MRRAPNADVQTVDLLLTVEPAPTGFRLAFAAHEISEPIRSFVSAEDAARAVLAASEGALQLAQIFNQGAR